MLIPGKIRLASCALAGADGCWTVSVICIDLSESLTCESRQPCQPSQPDLFAVLPFNFNQAVLNDDARRFHSLSPTSGGPPVSTWPSRSGKSFCGPFGFENARLKVSGVRLISLCFPCTRFFHRERN